MTPLELAVLALIVGAAFATAALKSVLNSVVAFGAYSLSIAIIWVFLRAPTWA
nr:hydrogenase subunit MbhD domain-containing protein [Halolamina rubra]